MATESDRLKRIETHIARDWSGINYVLHEDKLP